MQGSLQAVIFDMDGVLIDSEPLWRKAMIKGFTGAGMPFTEADCRKTMGIRIGEVVTYWLSHYGVGHIHPPVLEQAIVAHLLELIAAEGTMLPGIAEILALCHEKGLKTGLATSSSNQLMQAVLKKLELETTFHAMVSAELMPYGKPHPLVFLTCAGQLQVAPANCLVIEDSLNGVIAAKAAQMTVIAVPEPGHQKREKFIVADYCIDTMPGALALFKTLLG